jgi:hypothetical protein
VKASSERLASGGDHLITDGSSHLCTDDSPAVAITSARAPLRKGPCPHLPMGGGGDNEAIKAKELEAQRQVALMVSPVEATTSAVDSLTSGGDHLSADDSSHPRTSGLPAMRADAAHAKRSSLLSPPMGVRTRPSKNAAAIPHGVRCLVRPPDGGGTVRPAARKKPWMWQTCARRDRRPCGGRTATPRPDQAAPKPSRPRSQTRGS